MNVVEYGDDTMGGVKAPKGTVQDVLMQEHEESKENDFVRDGWQHDVRNV